MATADWRNMMIKVIQHTHDLTLLVIMEMYVSRCDVAVRQAAFSHHSNAWFIWVDQLDYLTEDSMIRL